MTHSTKAAKQFYMKAVRNSNKEQFKYSVAEMGTNEANPIDQSGVTKKIQPQQPFLFQVENKSWKKRSTCYQLENWQSMMTGDFANFSKPQVEHLGVSKAGAFAYNVVDSLPSLLVKISKKESILKYILNDSIIINDESFQSKIERKNSSWVIQLKGMLRQCPSVIGMWL